MITLHLCCFSHRCFRISAGTASPGSGAGFRPCVYKQGRVQVRARKLNFDPQKAVTQSHAWCAHGPAESAGARWNADNNGGTSPAAPEMFQQAWTSLDSSVTDNWAHFSGFLVFPDAEKEAVLRLVNSGMVWKTWSLHPPSCIKGMATCKSSTHKHTFATVLLNFIYSYVYNSFPLLCVISRNTHEYTDYNPQKLISTHLFKRIPYKALKGGRGESIITSTREKQRQILH